MRIVIKHPNQYPELADIDDKNQLKALQKIVGGYIELINVTDKIALLVDEEGKLKSKTRNIMLTDQVGCIRDVCVGTIAAIGLSSNGEEFRELTQHECKYIADWLDIRSI